MESWKTGTNLWLSAGAGLYWASYSFRLMDAVPHYTSSIGTNAHVLANAFMFASVIGVYLFLKSQGIKRAHIGIPIAMIIASTVVLVFDAARLALPVPVAVALTGLDYFTLGANMVLWGLAFASLEKYLAANSVIVAVLMASALTLVGQSLAAYIPLPWMTDVCTVGSAALMLGGRIPLCNQTRRRIERPQAKLAKFFGQRLAFGFPLGLFPLWVGLLALPGLDPLLLAFALAALAAATFATLHLGVPPYTTLPAVTLVAMGMLCLPHVRGGAASMMPSLLAGIWIAWQTFSSVQLSALKERLGFSELGITLADKVAIGVAALLGSAARTGFDAALGWQTRPLAGGAVESSLLMTSFALVLASTLALARLVGTQQEDSFKSRAAQTNAEREEQLFATIASEYGLSPREREVFEVLAQGYTSAFAADETGITHGTVKAHVAHIYRKLDIHNRDELLKLVEDREAAL